MQENAEIRTPTGYAAAFGQFFKENATLEERNPSWMALTNATVQYVPAIRPGNTQAQHTKYCSGYAPNDKRELTCRQIGNLRGQEQLELAADHLIKKSYTKRFNTITQYLERGTLDEQTAAAMKALAAKGKLEKALQDNDYAQSSYTAEMEQTALLAQANTHRKQ